MWERAPSKTRVARILEKYGRRDQVQAVLAYECRPVLPRNTG
ncbi:hypothetical protein [Streptomyces sp. LN704]